MAEKTAKKNTKGTKKAIATPKQRHTTPTIIGKPTSKKPLVKTYIIIILSM